MSLFSEHTLGQTRLKNRVVMAPMTRCRAINNVPTPIMADYYAQRASAGLIVTEGTSPSPNGLGYPRIPGIFTKEQVDGWRAVTDAVHAAGGKIFVQLMHTGRIAHPINMPDGAEMVAPSAIAAAGDMFTDTDGMQPHPEPRAMTDTDIRQAIEEFVTASQNAIDAGFDGVELHGANGYLLEQFLNPNVNTRDDQYGGSVENRARFVIEVAKAVADAIGPERTGIRLSPHGTFNDHAPYDDVTEQYGWLAREFERLGLVYVHLVLGQEGLPEETSKAIRDGYTGTLIVNTGFDRQRADNVIATGGADLVSFGVPFIANPDLVDRLDKGLDLAAPRQELFYAPGTEGYSDYPRAS